MYLYVVFTCFLCLLPSLDNLLLLEEGFEQSNVANTDEDDHNNLYERVRERKEKEERMNY